MQLPPASREIASKVECIKGDHLESWLRGMQCENEQFFGVEIVQMGHVKLFAARSLQEIGLFNVVVGLTSQDEKLLPDILRFYQDRDIQRYHIEINPYQVNTKGLQALTQHGFVVSAFQTYLYGLSNRDISSFLPSHVVVRPVTDSDVHLFADLHIQGFKEALSRIPEETVRRYRESVKVLYQIPEWHLSIIQIGNVSVGMSMLYIKDDIALLAGGAILPAYRGQGGHTASLHHRFQIARQAQCPFIVGQTSVGSQSQANMQHFHMQTIYTGTNWVHQM